MTVIESEILQVIAESDGIKAVDISREVKIPKKEVNHYLYGSLSQFCWKDENFLWHSNVDSDIEIKDSYSKEISEKIEKVFLGSEFTAEDIELYLRKIGK